MSKENKKVLNEDVQEEQVVQQEVNEVKQHVEEKVPEKKEKVKKESTEVLGEVHNCGYLRLRKQANPKAEVIEEIKVGEVLTIDLGQSSDTFFKVSTPKKNVGFVMKDYVNLIK